MRGLKPALIALCAVLSAGEAPAQVTLGLKAGVNVADLSVRSDDGSSVDVDPRTTFGGGAYLQAGLGAVFALQAEALYTQRGGRSSDDGLNLELGYVDVPMLFVARVPAGEAAIQPVLYAGPVVSFETACRLRSDEGATVDCDSGGDGLTTKSPDLGASVGGGLEVFMGGYTLQLDVRYTHGFVDIDDSADSDGRVRNRTWSFYLGLGRVLVP
ncbi:MAG: PorT family protein [Gemmatimonadetes bacterium]|nr:PorT family protein [Gemmatimonadota bacterium]